MPEIVSEYNVGLNPIVNESQLDSAIKAIDAKLRKVRSGAHENLATQLQALLQTTMRVARLPSPTKAMEYISNTTGGGYTYAQKRVITSGVGKAMTNIRGATQAESAAARAQAQENARVIKMTAQRDKEQAQLDRWFLKLRPESPLQKVQATIATETEANVGKQIDEKERFQERGAELLDTESQLVQFGGTEKELDSLKKGWDKYYKSFEKYAKTDLKNGQTLVENNERVQNLTMSDLRQPSGDNNVVEAIGSLGRRFLALGTLIKGAQAIWKFISTQADVARDLSMNPDYSKSGEIYARNMYGMSQEEYKSHSRDTQLFATRMAFGDISENTLFGLSLLRDGGATYRAMMSGDETAVMASMKSALNKMPANQARYVASLLGYENLLSDRYATRETRRQMAEAAVAQGKDQVDTAATFFNQEVQSNAFVHKGQGWFFRLLNRNQQDITEAAIKNPEWWGGQGQQAIETERLKQQVLGNGERNFIVNIQMENNFDGVDSVEAANKTKDDIYNALAGMTFEEMQMAQQYNAGRAR